MTKFIQVKLVGSSADVSAILNIDTISYITKSPNGNGTSIYLISDKVLSVSNTYDELNGIISTN